MVQIRSIRAKTHSPPTGKCLLLALPPELRIRIYEYVMPKSSDPVVMIRKGGVLSRNRPGALIWACRQLQSEALAVYFKMNEVKLYYAYTECPLPKAAYNICLGWIGQNFGAVKSLRIVSGPRASYRLNLYFDLTSGLQKYALQTEAQDQWQLPQAAQFAKEIRSEVRQYLNGLLVQLQKEKKAPFLDGKGLLGLMELLSDKHYSWSVRFSVQADFQPIATISS